MWKPWKKKEQIRTASFLAPALVPRLTLTILPEACKPRGRGRAKRSWRGKNTLKLLFWLLLGGGLLLPGQPLRAEEIKVPPFINFQSVLTDAGGVPLADGLYNVTFRIRGGDGAVLYEEAQSLESAGGVVSAMIGAKEGIPREAILPSGPKFLGVTVEGGGPETQMEIVSVPYAMVAEASASALPQSIGTAAIRPKAITADLLSDDLLDALAQSLTVEKMPALFVTKENFDSSVQQTQANLEQQGLQLNQRIDVEISQLQAAQAILQQELANTATREYVDQQVATRATREYVDQQVATRATREDLAAGLEGVRQMVANQAANVPPPDPVSNPVIVAAATVSNEQPAQLGHVYNVDRIVACSVVQGRASCPGDGTAQRVLFQTGVGAPNFVQVSAVITAPVVNDFRPYLLEATADYVTVRNNGSVAFHVIVFR